LKRLKQGRTVRLKTAVEEVKNKAGPPSEKLNMVRLRTAVEEVES